MVFMIQMRWCEPEIGSYAIVSDLTATELVEVEKAIAWLEEQAGEHWGDTIPSFEVQTAQDGLSGGYDLKRTLREIRLQSRYEEDGIYNTRYQPFDDLGA